MRFTETAVLLVGMALTAIGCANRPVNKLGAGDPPAGRGEVTMLDSRFQPESLNVSAGDTVVWVNQGGLGHTATSGTVGHPDGKWDSGIIAPRASYRHVFATPGTYHYYCIPHGEVYGMKGVIVVR